LFSSGGGGLFGNTTQPQTTAQQPQNSFSNLFNKPANAPAATGGGLFGTQPSTLGVTTSGQQGSLFGNPSANQQQPSGSSAFGGLFGKPTMPAGQTQSTMGQPGGTSLWGNTLGTNSFNLSGAPGAAGTVAASISEPIASNLSIFSMLPPGPRAVALDQTKKKPSYFVDVPTRSPVPRLQLGYTPASSKLRGFGSSTSSPLGTSGDPFAGLSHAAGTTNVLSLNGRTAGRSDLNRCRWFAGSQCESISW
jgi:nuclear pore complex protein Nup98-Nup96